MARITRNIAAEILGVSRQTISNYIKEGILGSYVGEHGILYVNSEDIEKYRKMYPTKYSRFRKMYPTKKMTNTIKA